MRRDVLHLHIPALPVALARAAHPELVGRPVAVSARGPRGVVHSLSAEARAEGVSKGMPVAEARRRCRSLTVTAPDPTAMAAVAGALAREASSYTPLWEPERPGHLYMDMTGSSRLMGQPRDVAARLAAEVHRRYRLDAGVGVGPNKLVASVASRILDKNGVCDVMRGTERQFLAPLPVGLIPGVGAKRLALLADWNVRTIGEFGRIPPAELRRVFGSQAGVLQQRALGLDWTPVKGRGEEARVRRVHVLGTDENDDSVLLAYVGALLGSACFELRRLGKVCGRLRVAVGYADGVESSRTCTLENPASWEFELSRPARELFILATARRVRVRRVELVLTRLMRAPAQLELFDERSAGERRMAEQRARLGGALDEIRSRYGLDAVGEAANLRARQMIERGGG